MKNIWNRNRKLVMVVAVLAIVAVTAIGSASKNKKASFASTQSLSPEAAAEAETESLSSRFVLPTDPESRVRMPLHTKVITDWAPRRRRHYSSSLHAHQ